MRCRHLPAKQSLPYLGSLSALFAATGSADAAIKMSTTVGAGLTPPATEGVTLWDVDGDGTNDFGLNNNYGFRALFTANDTANRAVANKTHGIHLFALQTSFTIGPTLNAAYTFKKLDYALEVLFTDYGELYGAAAEAGFAIDTPSFIGFRFKISGSFHYGWATLTPTAGPIGQGITITEGYYEDVADTPIMAGDTGAVPEPEVAAVGLGALALGAAGLRRWRKGKAAVRMEA